MKSVSYLEYPLAEGYIDHWLVAGPLSIPLTDLGVNAAPDGAGDAWRKEHIAQRFYTRQSQVAALPVDRDRFDVEGVSLAWRYVRSRGDHFVDASGDCPTWQYRRAWAYSQIQSSEAQAVSFTLTTHACADVWLNGQHCYRREGFGFGSHTFESRLAQGSNELLVRFEAVGLDHCPCLMALRLSGFSADEAEDAIQIKLPTHAKRPERQKRLERLLDYAHLQDVVSYRGTVVNLHWADDMTDKLNYAYQIQDDLERIYIDGKGDAEANGVIDIGHPQRIFERPVWVVLKALPMEFFDQDLRYQLALPLQVLDTAYANRPYGAFNARHREALEYAAKREGNLFAEIARLALEKTEIVEAVVIEAIRKVAARQTDSPVLLVGLLGLLARFGDQPAFPPAIKPQLEACSLGFRYGVDDPGSDKEAGLPVDFTREPDQILVYTAELLAGQLYADRDFTAAGQTGQWHRERAEKSIHAWLLQRGRVGFQAWHSDVSFEAILVALSHLTSLAQSETIRDLAAVVMDKLFFIMAVNSFEGAFGSTRGDANAAAIKSAQLEATSGLMRMMWGMGGFNPHIQGIVSLACSTYEFPQMIADLAADRTPELWNRERQLVDPVTGQEVNTASYRTADYLLSSAQDYRPGQPGNREHIWQATLGSDALVFVNHPACSSEDDALPAGLWRGNAVLPRVAQWKDTLIAVHELPADDWMGFTHAYFPTKLFDEVALRQGWIFARKGSGYLALTAAQGLELIKRAPDGYRELRSYGKQNVWLCQMGRAAVDGAFEAFCDRVLALPLAWQSQGVQFTNLRGEKLSFGWTGPLLVDDNEQPLAGFKHYENAYGAADFPAALMEARVGDQLMQLNFE